MIVHFLVKSRHDPDSEYDTRYLYTCAAEKDGLPCSHQSAVELKFHVASLNTIPTLQAECRHQLGTGSSSISFYSPVLNFINETN